MRGDVAWIPLSDILEELELRKKSGPLSEECRLTRVSEKLIPTAHFCSRMIRAVEPVTDGGSPMVGRSKHRLFWMVVLMVAEVTQGITPDTGSVASARLFEIIEAMAGRDELRTTRRLDEGSFTTPTDKLPPPSSPFPFEDRDEENAPDEVCLAAFELASQLTDNEVGDTPESHFVPFDPSLLSMRSCCPGSSYDTEPVPSSSARVRSLCRMNC